MATKTYNIVPNVRTNSASMKEAGSSFQCPTNMVMTGRYHTGDENGQTQYEYATLKIVDAKGNLVSGTITVEDVKWDTTSIKESSGNGYSALPGRVIVGRKHSGDENGQTTYATAVVKYNGKATELVNSLLSASIKESSGTWFRTDANRVIVSRVHKGDENGQTTYTSATITVTLGESQDPAPKDTIIVPDVRATSENIEESKGGYTCRDNTVMTGRYHKDGANGTTIYEYATLKAIDPQGKIVHGTITVDYDTTSELQESSGNGYDAPLNGVIVGRVHSGNENGTTTYLTAIIKFNGHKTRIINYTTSEARHENEWGWFNTEAKYIMTGRHHFGNENGNTYYCMGTVSCDEAPVSEDKFKVVVKLHPDEDYYPMGTLDFIRLSRFRMHFAGAHDSGFSKSKRQFVPDNDEHTSDYYNIPVSIINSYYVKNDPAHALDNLRPRDKNSIGYGEVFLQPDDDLKGDFAPDGRVPVYTYSTFYTTADNKQGERKEFWVFYGYDYSLIADAISYSHQGDWERIILDIIDNKIAGAWLSHHGKLTYNPANGLYIATNVINGQAVQTLTVYSAKGTHAHYPKEGNYHFAGTDHAANGGCEWTITDNAQPLDTQLWRDYAGAWGEVGDKGSTTGPLGPWYKRWDFGTQSDADIPLPRLIPGRNDVLIMPNIRSDSEGFAGTGNYTFETPGNTVMTGRQCEEDDDGNIVVIYQYATLKATDLYCEIIVDEHSRQWSEWHKESDSNFFHAPANKVITGERHLEGEVSYQTAIVLYNGAPTTVTPADTLGTLLPNVTIIESGGIYFRSASRFVITGRTHTGGEDGTTTYYTGYITFKY